MSENPNQIVNDTLKRKWVERVAHLEEQLLTHQALVDVLSAQVAA